MQPLIFAETAALQSTSSCSEVASPDRSDLDKAAICVMAANVQHIHTARGLV